ncbi:MAG: zinc ABC transporter substrate-binding protein [Cocleimonas sp.]
MRRIVLYFFMLGILSSLASAVSAEQYASKINVLSSIKPVQMIVTAIAGERVNSDQLIPNYTSPHDYSFKPSDIRKIKRADVIFRIDEHFETMLNTAFASAPSKSKIISLAENPSIKLLPAAGGHKHEEGHEDADMHIFTSPENALIMAQQIAEVLAKVDAKNTGYYQKNLHTFNQTVTREIALIQSKLEPVKNKPFMVFHHSWQYFSDYFGLQQPTIIELHEGISTGAKTILSIHREISSNNIHCVFSGPSIPKKRMSLFTENHTIKTVELDIMGQQLSLKKDSYLTWLSTMTSQVQKCLVF